MTLTGTDDLDFGTNKKFLPQGIHKSHVKYETLSLTIKKNMAKVNVFFRQTDRQTGQKLYAIDLSMWGYKTRGP